MLARLIRPGVCQKYESVRFPKLISRSIKMTENGEPHTKKKILQIGTHDGNFHCDEALACSMLKLLPEYKDAKIIRSRNLDVLASCDIVVDVGGTYDPASHRYDHHQLTFNETFSSVKSCLSKKYSIKLSSAGLIYTHFGERIIKQLTDLEEKGTMAVYEKIYENFVQEIDAIDNGVPICDGEPKYHISTNLSSRIGDLNPAWNVTPTKSQDEIFEEAVVMTGNEFLDKVNYYSNSWWLARDIVSKAVKKRHLIHESGKIIELEDSAPWKQHFFDIEKETGIDGEVRFVLFPDKSDWRVMSVPIEPNSFICRTFLKKEWRGIRDEELIKVSGIDGCIFCHHTGFIGGNQTREGALQMAIKSL